jgi:para-nitrobenzyl esterase
MPPPNRRTNVGFADVRLQRLLRVTAVLVGPLMLASCGFGATQAPAQTLVQTSSGAMRGAFADDHLLFAGIPYAAPPVGPLRWRPPQPAARWQGVRDGSKFGQRCTQDVSKDADYGRPVGEDCLTLNVWAPIAATGTPRPVMVWIHGGAFANGSGDPFDARRLVARGGIVVVTINYRLGALGFLAHPALAPDGDAGNYGFEDQQAALRWVHDNIAEFGGDPAKVTIAGESAGAMSVCDHLVAPGSAGLFRAAILQSGLCQAQGDLAAAQRTSLGYAAGLGCGDPGTAAACLRGLPAEKLKDPPWFFPLGKDGITGPVTGTAELPTDPMAAFARGAAARVPVLIGTNHDEWRLFTALQYLARGQMPEYPHALADWFGIDSDHVAQHYPLSRYGSGVLAYSAAITDSVFACPAMRIASQLASGAQVYGYEFNDQDTPAPEPMSKVPFPVGAAHSLEVRYLFDSGSAPRLNAAQQKLSEEMISYWASFVTSGTPHADGAPAWPVLGGAEGPWMSLQTPEVRTTTSFADDHQCGFWASVGGPR